MRILQFIIFWFFALIFISGVSFLIAQEVLLYMGRKSISDAVRELQRIKVQGSYDMVCSRFDEEDSEESVIVRDYQLTFIDDTTFAKQVVCDQFGFAPISTQSETLPPFVSKVPGSSGILLNQPRSAVVLTAFDDYYQFLASLFKVETIPFQRFYTVMWEDFEVRTLSENVQDIGVTPLAMCESYGYQCCNESFELGQGKQLLGAQSCERTCYQTCKARPVVLSLATDPFFDPATRIVTVSSGMAVEFNYVIDVGGASLSQGTLDFGDGTQAPITTLTGRVSHTYVCAQAECQFSAQIVVTDTNGLSSALVPQSAVIIQVNR